MNITVCILMNYAVNARVGLIGMAYAEAVMEGKAKNHNYARMNSEEITFTFDVRHPSNGFDVFQYKCS